MKKIFTIIFAVLLLIPNNLKSQDDAAAGLAVAAGLLAIGSGVAFLVAQLLDVQIFDNLRKNKWFIAPLTSSIIGSTGSGKTTLIDLLLGFYEPSYGKILIDDKYPFALIKYLDENFKDGTDLKSENAVLRIKVPNWIP